SSQRGAVRLLHEQGRNEADEAGAHDEVGGNDGVSRRADDRLIRRGGGAAEEGGRDVVGDCEAGEANGAGEHSREGRRDRRDLRNVEDPEHGQSDERPDEAAGHEHEHREDRKSTRLNSSHVSISYAVFCLKKKKKNVSKRRVIKISSEESDVNQIRITRL